MSNVKPNKNVKVPVFDVLSEGCDPKLAEKIHNEMIQERISMNKGELIYLACPYSHKDPRVREERFNQVNKVASGLMSEGFYIFSPISHTHPIALEGKLPLEWEFWEGYDTSIIKHCKCVLVLQLDGWKESTGVQSEIKIAEKFGIPVEYMEFIDLRLQ